jgi:hypothetical protein
MVTNESYNEDLARTVYSMLDKEKLIDLLIEKGEMIDSKNEEISELRSYLIPNTPQHTTIYTPPFKTINKHRLAVTDSKGNNVVTFKNGHSVMAKNYCSFLNNCEKLTKINKH